MFASRLETQVTSAQMAHDVFISHSARDRPFAYAACATIETRKIRCWIAPRDITPGSDYAAALVDAIENARAMVVVLSSNSNASPQVLREVERAVSRSLPILPVRIENIELSKSMEYFVSSRHWLDAMTPPLEKHLERLADALMALLGGEKAVTTPPAATPPVRFVGTVPATGVAPAAVTPKKIVLLVADGRGTTEVTFDGSRDRRVLVGRGLQCEIPIKSPQVSQKHAMLTLDHGEWILQDLGSINGTRLNGNDVRSEPVREGDRIMLGDATIVVVRIG
jgi:hypothetical protein